MESASQIRVLVVDDDDRLAELIARYLTSHGLEVGVAHDGLEGQAEALRHSYDCVMLDANLPGRDGLAVCREIRAHSAVPILIVTTRATESDRVLGLESGADDYLTKPFSARELLARIRAAVRRARREVGPHRAIEVGGLTLDPCRMSATVDAVPLDVTAHEFAILWTLALSAGRVVSREQLLDFAHRGSDTPRERTIDVHVSRLRTKLGDLRNAPRLQTIRGIGYMIVP